MASCTRSEPAARLVAELHRNERCQHIDHAVLEAGEAMRGLRPGQVTMLLEVDPSSALAVSVRVGHTGRSAAR